MSTIFFRLITYSMSGILILSLNRLPISETQQQQEKLIFRSFAADLIDLFIRCITYLGTGKPFLYEFIPFYCLFTFSDSFL